MTDGTKIKVVKGFMCRCDPESETECDETLAEVKERLGTDDSNLLTAVVQSLNWDYDAYITTIANDHWSVVHAKTHEPSFVTEFQCDHVEDGVAATWKALADHFGKNGRNS